MPSRVTGFAEALGGIIVIKENRTISTMFTRIWVAALNLSSAVPSGVTIFANALAATRSHAYTTVFAWIWDAITGRYLAVLPFVSPTAHALWIFIINVDTSATIFARIWIAECSDTRLVAVFSRVAVYASTMVTGSGARS